MMFIEFQNECNSWDISPDKNAAQLQVWIVLGFSATDEEVTLSTVTIF